MFKYKVRSNSGRIIMETNSKESAERHAKQNKGYVKTDKDGYNPFKEEGKIAEWTKK